MNTRVSIRFGVVVALLVGGCFGGGSAKGVATSYGGGGYQSSPASGSAPMAAEAADTGAYTTSVEPAPTERPGLGTTWGEDVSSHVDLKAFYRATSHPFATVTVHYNDAEGVSAHAGYLGQGSLAPVRAYTPYGGISVALTDQYGALLPGGSAAGRTLIVGSAGQRYNIVLENRTGGRYEVVASVDGLDVVDGRPADLAKRGYIIEPYGSLVIDGFRRSDDTVAAFRFGRVADSYAARTSGDRNVGVIGVAVFAERGSVWTSDELQRRDTAQPFPGDRFYARPPG